jgi:hypothetical protein
MSIIDDILIANHGRRLQSVAVLAHALMKGERARLKMGYSRGSALISAIEAMINFTTDERETIDILLDARIAVDPIEYGPREKQEKEALGE